MVYKDRDEMAIKRLLLVEDDRRMRNLLSHYFRNEGFEIMEADNGQHALDIFRAHKIDLVILDIMLPIIDGWQVCSAIRKKSQDIAIILVTARDLEEDKLFGFELGADDYVTKPFSPKVLVARAQTLMKRVQRNISSDSPSLQLNGLKIDNTSHVVTMDDQLINLSNLEYALLSYLLTNKGRVLTRHQILETVWGSNFYGDTRTVDTHIWRLRDKIKHSDVLISTVRGTGYRLEG